MVASDVHKLMVSGKCLEVLHPVGAVTKVNMVGLVDQDEAENCNGIAQGSGQDIGKELAIEPEIFAINSGGISDAIVISDPKLKGDPCLTRWNRS